MGIYMGILYGDLYGDFENKKAEPAEFQRRPLCCVQDEDTNMLFND